MQPPATPAGPQPYWAPPRRSPTNSVAIAVVAVILVVFLVVMLAAFALFGGFGASSLALMFGPFCAIFFAIIVVIIAAVLQGTRRNVLPPPPPIQQPMVPAGTQGPVALNCPNCGAPPANVDRFGVATCTYCGTRFIVR